MTTRRRATTTTPAFNAQPSAVPKVPHLRVTIEYEVRVEDANLPELLDNLRELGYARVAAVQLFDKER